jgi:hypothetical protein
MEKRSMTAEALVLSTKKTAVVKTARQESLDKQRTAQPIESVRTSLVVHRSTRDDEKCGRCELPLVAHLGAAIETLADSFAFLRRLGEKEWTNVDSMKKAQQRDAKVPGDLKDPCKLVALRLYRMYPKFDPRPIYAHVDAYDSVTLQNIAPDERAMKQRQAEHARLEAIVKVARGLDTTESLAEAVAILGQLTERIAMTMKIGEETAADRVVAEHLHRAASSLAQRLGNMIGADAKPTAKQRDRTRNAAAAITRAVMRRGADEAEILSILRKHFRTEVG